MNPYNFIIDNQGASHSIFSQQGRNLLKQYLRNYKNGGMDEAEAGGMYKCKTMKEEDGTYTACKGTDDVKEATHFFDEDNCEVVERMGALETKKNEDFDGAEVYFDDEYSDVGDTDELRANSSPDEVVSGAESKSSTPDELRAATEIANKGSDDVNATGEAEAASSVVDPGSVDAGSDDAAGLASASGVNAGPVVDGSSGESVGK